MRRHLAAKKSSEDSEIGRIGVADSPRPVRKRTAFSLGKRDGPARLVHMDKALAILVVDDDPDVVFAARYALTDQAARIEGVTGLAALDSALAAVRPSAVLLDMNFVAGDNGGRDGLDALAKIHAADPTLAVVLMTAYGGVQLAVEALKRGAVDFVLKPWKNERLAEAMSAAIAITRARRAARGATLEDLERDAIRQALADHDGNISKAAGQLGVTRPALYRKIEKHGL